MNLLQWLRKRGSRADGACEGERTDSEKSHDKINELEDRLHNVASRTHVIEFEAYRGPKPKQRRDSD